MTHFGSTPPNATTSSCEKPSFGPLKKELLRQFGDEFGIQLPNFAADTFMNKFDKTCSSLHLATREPATFLTNSMSPNNGQN